MTIDNFECNLNKIMFLERQEDGKLTNQSEWIERAKEVLPVGGFGNFDPSALFEKVKDLELG